MTFTLNYILPSIPVIRYTNRVQQVMAPSTDAVSAMANVYFWRFIYIIFYFSILYYHIFIIYFVLREHITESTTCITSSSGIAESAMLASFSINVQLYSQNHNTEIFSHPMGHIRGNISALSKRFNTKKLYSRVLSRGCQFYL